MPRFATVSVCLVLALAGCGSAPAEPDTAAQGTPSSAPTNPAMNMPASPVPTVERVFEGGVSRIGPELREVLIGRNWTPGCPVPLEDLRLVRVSYWNFDGEVRTGPFVLHKRVAADVLWVSNGSSVRGSPSRRSSSPRRIVRGGPRTTGTCGGGACRRPSTAGPPPTALRSPSTPTDGPSTSTRSRIRTSGRRHGAPAHRETVPQPIDRSERDDPRGRRRGSVLRSHRLGVGRTLAHAEGLHALLADRALGPMGTGVYSSDRRPKGRDASSAIGVMPAGVWR